jgi:CRP-like cAMP-binding protein
MSSDQAKTANTPILATRLLRLATLEPLELQALQMAEREHRRRPPRRELITEGAPLRERFALLSGWACRQRILRDGRRQILGFLLPGDLIGMCRHANPIAATTIVAVTEVVTCPVPDAGPGSGLSEAYARSAALEEQFFLAHIMRLGRLNAYERMADWLLETQDRLAAAGLSLGNEFPLPLTQEMLADALGLTSVHVNRTLKALRLDGLVTSRGGMISLSGRGQLERLVDYKPARVSSDS